MSVTDRKTKPLQRAAAPTAQPPAAAPARNPYRILAVVDGTERTNHVVEFIASLAARGSAIEVVALNVQSKRDDRLRGYGSFKRGEVDNRLIDEIGMPVVSSFGRRLEKFGIATQGRVEIGEPADVILRCAAEELCDAVVIGEEPPNALGRFLIRAFGIVFGIAASLAVLSERPVIVVK